MENGRSEAVYEHEMLARAGSVQYTSKSAGTNEPRAPQSRQSVP